MSTYLLDANVLIALLTADHVHHSAVATWITGVERAALCPITEGALVRTWVRLGEAPGTAAAALAALYGSARFEFWADDASYVDVGLDHVVGHRQVTDAYLAALAHARGALVATFDKGLAQSFPGSTHLLT